LIRHTGAAIATLFGLLFVPPFVLGVLGVLGSAGIAVARFTPMIILLNSVGVVAPTPGCLSAWAGLGVMALYAVVALGLGGWLLTRRDA
jgi:ABC-2 type transport system permease protein